MISLIALPIIFTGSLTIEKIAHIMPYCLIKQPLLIPIWFIALLLLAVTEQAEIERNPFSMPHAETEIVAGYLTEFSGTRLALVNLARDAQLAVTSSFVASIFIGGLLTSNVLTAKIINVVILLLETFLVVFVATEIKCITARLRIDIALDMFWKYIIPSCIGLLLLAIVVKVII